MPKPPRKLPKSYVLTPKELIALTKAGDGGKNYNAIQSGLSCFAVQGTLKQKTTYLQSCHANDKMFKNFSIIDRLDLSKILLAGILPMNALLVGKCPAT